MIPNEILGDLVMKGLFGLISILMLIVGWSIKGLISEMKTSVTSLTIAVNNLTLSVKELQKDSANDRRVIGEHQKRTDNVIEMLRATRHAMVNWFQTIRSQGEKHGWVFKSEWVLPALHEDEKDEQNI